ncbi:MAG: hypothetical protein JW850_01635 [Thermoflexales bacterium]|nr:hypothetical protein [Thermoflexales bacterium]
MNSVGIVIAYFLPIGFLLVAWNGLPPARARLAAGNGLLVMGLASVAYAVCGFAFQFGGLGLVTSLSGYESLRSVASLLGAQEAGWGFIGLRGFLLGGGAVTPEISGLFLHHLPLVLTAVLIPSLALAGRVRSLGLAALAVAIAGLVYPLAANWIGGGGWLANLGTHLQLGHGVVDFAGAGPVYLLGGGVAAIGLVLFGHRPLTASDAPSELPPAHFPLLAAVGAGLFGLGWMAWVGSEPLHGADPALNLPLAMTNGLLSAAAAAVITQGYGWLASARVDPAMAARGWLAGWVIVSAGAPFIPTWMALVLGTLAGIWLPLGAFIVERALRREDSTGAVSLCGLLGLWGVLAPGALADGNWGAGWNGVGADEYLAVKGQGVTGMFTPGGFIADPGQFTAQLVELAVILALAALAAWIVLGVLRLAARRWAVMSPSPASSQLTSHAGQ